MSPLDELLALQRVAEIFAVESALLEEACARGLLRPVERDGTRALPVDQFDRVARIVALHVHIGLDWDALVLVLVER